MNGESFWQQRHNRVFAHGGWQIGKGISVRGYSLLDELVGKHSFFQLLCLNVLGYLPEQRLARWIEGSFMCLSFPDPRIWCNHIAALAGSSRCSSVVSINAGLLASDSSLYGPGATLLAVEFLQDAGRAVADGKSVRQFLMSRTARSGRLRAPGFSRPIATGDDRVLALARLARELEFPSGSYEHLAWSIDAVLREQGDNALNMLGYGAAFLLDRDLDVQAGCRLFSLCVNAGVHACFVEAADAPAGGFLPLQCSDIEYSGAPARALPQEFRT